MTANDSTTRVISDSGDDVGPGQRLREAREAANLTLPEVASRMRLEPHALERLENDDYEHLHGPTFVRGYLSGYARLLDLPERPILEAYERHGHGPPALVSELGRKPEVHVSDFPVRMVTYVIAGLLVVLVVLWWQSRQFDTGSRDHAATADETVEQTSDSLATDDSLSESPPASPGSQPAAESTVEAAEPPTTEAVSETVGEDGTQPPRMAMLDEPATGSGATDTEPPPSEEALASEPRPEAGTGTERDSPSTTIAAEPAAAEPAAEAAAEPAMERADETVSDAANEAASGAASSTERGVAALESTDSAEGDASTADSDAEEEAEPTPRPARLPGTDVLAIQLENESWIEIYDRGGGRLYYGLAREGSEVVVRGAGPMQVLVGAVQGAVVAYNGEGYDLSRYRGRSVARFTVGELSSPTPSETPTPPAAQEPGTQEVPEPAGQAHEQSVADTDAASITRVSEPAKPPAAPGADLALDSALPAPDAGVSEPSVPSASPDS